MLTLRSVFVLWAFISTALVEAVTLYLRFFSGITAIEFNQTAPLLLQIHHMFWSVPLAAAAVVVWRRDRLRIALLGLACGMVLSDLLHHFLVLPVLDGSTGWHWP
jgi:hypothetical protein